MLASSISAGVGGAPLLFELLAATERAIPAARAGMAAALEVRAGVAAVEVEVVEEMVAEAPPGKES